MAVRTDGNKRMIFENEYVEELCLKFKRNKDFATFHRICDHLTPLISSIIRRSRYHRIVPFDDLISHLYNQVDRWVVKWCPGEGKFYTYAATSTKHGCISCVSRESGHRNRFQNLGDAPLDLLGSVASTHHSIDGSQAIAKCLTEISVRWVEPEINEAIRVILVSLLARRGESRGKNQEGKSIDFRRNLLNTLRLGYDLEVEEAKFLIDWTTGAVRNVLLEHFNSPLTGEDIARLSGKFTFIPDLINIFGLKQTKKMMLVFAGTSIRFPTLGQMRRIHAAGSAINGLMEDPTKFVESGLKVQGISEATLSGDIENMVGLMNSGVLEDQPISLVNSSFKELVEGAA